MFAVQLQRCLRFLHLLLPGAAGLQPEALLLIRYYVYKHSLLKNSATLGQQLLDLRLVDSHTYGPVSSHRLAWHNLFSLTAPYVMQRCESLFHQKPVSLLMDVLKLAELLNFVIFLTNGKFRSLSHRFLSIGCTHSSASAIFNPVNYDFMSREILWYTFAEFISFLLPLVNPVKVKNFISDLIGRRSSGISLISPGIRCKSDLLTCAVCMESPVNAREIGCNHCFCYYCVMTTCLADESYGFSCPKCNFRIRDVSEIRELYLKGF